MSEAHAEPSKPAAKVADGQPEKPRAAPRTGSGKSTAVPPSAGSPNAAAQPEGERGGPKGPEPTRYGDWEKGGRCFDF